MLREAASLSQRTMLFVHGLQVDALIGVYAPEREAPQQLIVDLEIEIQMPEVDHIGATLDYVGAAEIVRRCGASREFQLIETLAREIGREFCGLDGVRQLLVRVTKPSALASLANSTGVELVLKAGGE